MTKALTIEQVRAKREENTPKVFNLTLALQAAEKTPAKAHGVRGTSELTANILALFKAKDGALAANQVAAALVAGGMQVTTKQVSDRLWLLAKQKHLVKGANKGEYALATA